MSRCKISVSPPAICLLAIFVLLAEPVLPAAILLAAVCHEFAHYAVLRLTGRAVRELNFTAFGVEMKVAGYTGYAGEFLTTLAGPAMNLLLACGFGFLGRNREIFYLFSGAQAVLGVFNLLPLHPLDGGMVLWTAVACFTDPYTADRVALKVGFAAALCLTGFAVFLLLRIGGTQFFLIAALALLWDNAGEMGLVKRVRKR